MKDGLGTMAGYSGDGQVPRSHPAARLSIALSHRLCYNPLYLLLETVMEHTPVEKGRV